jgi:predicted dehydrogenase
LVEGGFTGRLHHVGLRYHAGYGLSGEYQWKFDARHNPTGALGDIGSHFLYLAMLLGGEVKAVTARLDSVGAHGSTDPEGQPYPPAADTAVVVMEFASGGQGVLHASAVAHEGTSMNQLHAIEVHGSEGTLRYLCDFDRTQQVSGARVGEGPPRPLPIPEEVWGPVRRDLVHDTYRDVFRNTDSMARGWAKALAASRPVRPDLRDGALVQSLLDACLVSSDRGIRVEVEGAGRV